MKDGCRRLNVVHKCDHALEDFVTEMRIFSIQKSSHIFWRFVGITHRRQSVLFNIVSYYKESYSILCIIITRVSVHILYYYYYF